MTMKYIAFHQNKEIVMKTLKLKYITWIPAAVIMMFILGFSNQTGDESSSLSLTISTKVIHTVNDVLDLKWTQNQIEDRIEGIHTPVRKLAHMGEYAVLTLAVGIHLIVLQYNRKKIFIIGMIIILLFAASDEIHQLFIPGRSGQIKDVLIDTGGGLISSIFLYLIRKDK